MFVFNESQAKGLLDLMRACGTDFGPRERAAAAAVMVRDAANESAPNKAERNMFIEEIVSVLREQQ